jgi:N-acetylmuramoyl-L-alanine amidase
MAFCYPDSTFAELPFSGEKLKRGAADYVVSEGESFVELYGGGFVGKSALNPITGDADITNRLLSAKAGYAAKSEHYIFTGTAKPAYLTGLEDESFTLTLLNTYGEAPLSVAESRLFSGVAHISAGDVISYEFELMPGEELWGYAVDYSGKATVLTFYYRPKTASLEGVKIALDAGHGGSDPGAAGVAGNMGPKEKDINLAHVTALAAALESRGAEVFLARPGDETVDLDSRLEFPEAVGADLYLSLHHNSIGTAMDANEVEGVEIYYHTPMSYTLAERLMAALTTELGRGERFTEASFYRVTLNPRCPAVMLELGFMSNPLEYERAAEASQIESFAETAAEALESLFAE